MTCLTSGEYRLYAGHDMATPKIRSANAVCPDHIFGLESANYQASTSSLAPTLPRTITVPLPDKSSSQNEEGAYTFSLHKALSLPKTIQDRIYTLFNENMAPLSQTSSLDYTESSKREELFDETGRFILLRKGAGDGSIEGEVGVDMPGGLPSGTAEEGLEGGVGESEEIVGYVSFRFDTEETLSSRDAELIYWYVSYSPFALLLKNASAVLVVQVGGVRLT
jgi:hypothetical protein